MNLLNEVATYFNALNWPRWYTIHLWRVNIITFPWQLLLPLMMKNGYFTLINYFGRDSPRADLPRSTTSNGQVIGLSYRYRYRLSLSVIGLSSTSSSYRRSSSVVVYGVCSRVFLVIHADWVSNSALFDLNLAISNSSLFLVQPWF